MAMRFAVLAMVAVTAMGLTAKHVASPEVEAAKKAAQQEIDMFSKDTSHYSHGDFHSHKRMFTLKEHETRVVKNEKGEPQCMTTCNGDPSDMVHPFYRYSTAMKYNKTQRESRLIDSFTVAKDTHFFNAVDTKICLKDKYVMFLGDSTLGENLNDIEFLLAGGPKHVNPEKFMATVTTQTKSTLSWETDKGQMTDRYETHNRKHSIKLKTQNINLKFYFTGATELDHNCDGISALLDPALQKRIDQYTETEGRQPDAIVMNSGPHDACRAWIKKDNYTTFFENVDKVGEEVIKKWTDKGIKVIFRGSYRFSGETAVYDPKFGDNRIPADVDIAAKEMIERNGGTYVDAAKVLATTHDSSGCCSTIRASTIAMPHLGSVALFKNKKASIFLSQLVSFKILDGICPKEV